MKTVKASLMATTIAGFAVAALAVLAPGAQAAQSLAKTCGPNNQYVIGFSQANFKEPYREHVNHDLQALVKNYPQFKLVIADGQANDNTQVSLENFLTQAGRYPVHLGFRSGAADARGQPGL